MKRLAFCSCLFFVLCAAADVGYFWHVTDIHYSPDYKEGTSQVFNCMKGVGLAGKYGEPTVCDTPIATVEATFDFMVATKPNPDFILYTGDTTPHESSYGKEATKADIMGYERNVTVWFQNYFPKVKAYPLFGNHDTYPRFQASNVTYDWLYTDLADAWQPFFNQSALAEIAKGGYFSELIEPGLRLVGVNTNVYYKLNKLDESIKDPLEQYAWLNATLTNARRNGEKVLLAYHVPLGYVGKVLGQMWDSRNDQLVDVFSPFHDIIIGHFAGHNHIDSYHLIEGTAGISALFLSPSVNELGLANPRVRLVKYQKNPFKLLDSTNYVMDLFESNKKKTPMWSKEYSMTELYGIPDISADGMMQLWENMQTNQTSFSNYMRYWKGYHFVGVACNIFDFCHREAMCSIRHIKKADVKKCVADSR